MIQLDKKYLKVLAIMGVLVIGLIAFIILKDKLPQKESLVVLEPAIENNSTKEDAAEDVPGLADDGIAENTPDDFTPKTIKVYIAGQVRNPGVLEVPFGCRLNEAVEMAGGCLEDADLLRVNLAIRLEDEGMYLIPKLGEEIPAYDNPAIGGKTADSKVNINTADQAQLETLPRIGPVIATNIIEYREKNGPFKKIEDIMNVSRIGEKTFEGLKDLISVN